MANAKTRSREAGSLDLDAIKSRIRDAWPIDDAIQHLTGATLVAKGRAGIKEACCPFHMERSPSFTVDVTQGRYHCFGSGCGARGDLFQLIMDVQGCDFRTAFAFAADHVGIEIPAAIRKDVRTPAGSGAASGPAGHKTISYPKVEVRQTPADLLPETFHPVPDAVRRPVAGQRFRFWDDGAAGKREKRLRDYRPEMVHEYRDATGTLLMSILRVRVSDTKKFFIPVRLMAPSGDCPSGAHERLDSPEGRLAWVLEGVRPGRLLPIYGMEDLPAWRAASGGTVLVVEGEKTRDAMRRLIHGADCQDNILVLSPMGGSQTSIQADWGPVLEGLGEQPVQFVIWPDADKPIKRPDGTLVDRVDLYVRQTLSALMQQVIDRGLDRSGISLHAISPPSGVDSGWDVADAEQEGWDGTRVIRYMENNSREIDMAALVLRKAPIQAAPTAPVESLEPTDVLVTDAPSEDASGAGVDISLNLYDALLAEEAGGFTAPADTASALIGADLPQAETIELGEVIDPDDLGDDGLDGIQTIMMNNPYFRCLGYKDGINYFQCRRSRQLHRYTADHLKKTSLLALADLEFWEAHFPGTDMRGRASSINQDAAINALIAASYRAGSWDPRKEISQGARMDRGRVAFNTGQRLYVDGVGLMDLDAYRGDFCYTVGPQVPTPAFDNPFTADSPEIREYLRIISALDWRADSREMAIMTTLGWVAIGPICGVLKVRPHLWLDGPFGSGKTWVADYIIKPALKGYHVSVVSNSTESGIRNMLAKTALPVIFDEAEGEDRNARDRMDAILSMARHSATSSDSVVAQGVSGGGAHRAHAVQSTFLMTSITAQLEASADASRFAHIHLGPGRKHTEFDSQIKIPAEDLLTEEFAARFVGRMVLRAKDFAKTDRYMVQALSQMGFDRRLSDIFGTYAAGCWLLLRDGVPEDAVEATEFIAEEFKVMQQISDRNAEIRNMKDHHRLFQAIMGAELQMESRNGGMRREKIGPLLEIAAGLDPMDDVQMTQEEARAALNKIGIRLSIGEEVCPTDRIATHVLIHRNSTALRALLDKTPWARSYADVMLQADNVKSGNPVRFSAAVGVGRVVVVPLSNFWIGVQG